MSWTSCLEPMGVQVSWGREPRQQIHSGWLMADLEMGVTLAQPVGSDCTGPSVIAGILVRGGGGARNDSEERD